jgi:hypothetical protein
VPAGSQWLKHRWPAVPWAGLVGDGPRALQCTIIVGISSYGHGTVRGTHQGSSLVAGVTGRGCTMVRLLSRSTAVMTDLVGGRLATGTGKTETA